MFIRESEEYLSEGILWNNMEEDYSNDLQPTIDIIEKVKIRNFYIKLIFNFNNNAEKA